MTTILIVTVRSMLIFITVKLTTLKKNNCFKVWYFEKHYIAALINRRESTLIGELFFLMIMHTVENDI